MTGWRAVPAKQRRAFRRRNHFARDLYTPKYGPRVKEGKKNHLIEELKDKDIEEELKEVDDMDFYWENNPVDEHGELYDLHKDLGLTSKE